MNLAGSTQEGNQADEPSVADLEMGGTQDRSHHSANGCISITCRSDGGMEASVASDQERWPPGTYDAASHTPPKPITDAVPQCSQPACRVQVEEGLRGKPLWTWAKAYVHKFRGGLDTRLPVPRPFELLWSWLGAFLGILAVSGLNELLFPHVKTTLLVPSFGASAVLLFGVMESKLAQPRNFIGGQILSAVVGLVVRMGLGNMLWLSAPLGMSLALLLMQLTSTTHPPGGATALVASSAKQLAPGHGWMFLAAVAMGTVAMQLVALVMNNLSPFRAYPTYWY